jgi:SPP1 gp7 family putative phage head morphogenesis protein
MAMPNAEYWKERFKQLEASAHRSAEATWADVEAMYRRADREIDQKMSAWYRRFAGNNGIADMAEARRLLNSRELKEFRWTVEEYIRRGKENGISADWSKQLENASARFHVTRLQALQLDLQQSVEELTGGQLDAFDGQMKRAYLDSYYHTAYEIQRGVGLGWDVAAVDRRQLEAVLKKPWALDGYNFSERIWTNKEALIAELQKQLTQSLMLGRGAGEAVEALSKKLGASKSNAARLLYTESAYFHSLSQGDSFREMGVKQFEFIATLDERTSEICQQMDGQIFDMKDYQPGTNVPPLHPWCRSVTAPYFKSLEGIGERATRDPETGKTLRVPRSMKYAEWKEKFVK